VALALKQVQADLAGSGLALKVYDCYRPQRAARTMVQWAHAGGSDANRRYYPRLQRSTLFALGYIATLSRHSTGTAVDASLVETAPAPAARFDPAAAYGPCNGPAHARAPDDSVDMGTAYDCFDVSSHTASPAIGAEQRQRRSRLVAAMAKRGFRNYHREWWHFSYSVSPPPQHYDFPIRPRTAKASTP
jgi:D-alanyl-D-alanine dipeptidase